MGSLWENNFEKSDIKSPREIIQEQCEELANITKGKITARITEYDGTIYESDDKNILKSSLLEKYSGFELDLKNKLGEISDTLTYEFFLTSKNTPKYKYRVFFLRHKIIPYPVKILLENSIAEELDFPNNSETVIICDNENELLIILKKIFNSNKVRTVINTLLSLN